MWKEVAHRWAQTVVEKWCEGMVARMSVVMRSYVGGGAPRSARVDLGDELQNFVASTALLGDDPWDLANMTPLTVMPRPL